MKVARNLKTVYRYLSRSKKAEKPLVAYLMVTNRCNLRCKMCTYWKGIYESEMSTEQVKEVIRKLSDGGIQILSITGGEPLIRDDICEIMNYAKHTAEIPYVRLQTNGTLFDEAKMLCAVRSLDDIWVSIDGLGDVHDTIRGRKGTFAKVKKNIEALNSMKDENVNLIMNMVVTKYNKHQIDAVKELAKKWKVRQLFFHKVANVRDEEYHTKQFSSDENDIGEKIYYPNRKGCILLYTNIMVNPEGNVVPCGVIDKMVVGSLLEEGLSSVWNGEAMQDVRRMVWNGLEVCKTCCVPNTTLKSRLTDTFNLWRVLK